MILNESEISLMEFKRFNRFRYTTKLRGGLGMFSLDIEWKLSEKGYLPLEYWGMKVRVYA
jgi:hypothetical protein